MRVLRVLIILILCFAACDETINHEPDAGTDDIDAMGSGGSMAITPSPRDSNLELVVLAASLVVMLGPVTARRRRRKDVTLPFS